MEEHNKILDKHVGLKIKERRKTLGMTQGDLAHILGLSHQQIQRYENGENTISMSRVLEIAKRLNVKPDYFYENAPLSDALAKDKREGIITREPNRAMRILLVEDTYSDEILFRKAAEKSAIRTEIHALQNPESVMAFLLQQGRTKPDLILLDINMPRLNGLDLLKKIKGDATLKNLPVVVLTNSVLSKDMLNAYESYANGFVQKNSDLLEFFTDVDLILQYWNRVIVLPSAA